VQTGLSGATTLSDNVPVTFSIVRDACASGGFTDSDTLTPAGPTTQASLSVHADQPTPTGGCAIVVSNGAGGTVTVTVQTYAVIIIPGKKRAVAPPTPGPAPAPPPSAPHPVAPPPRTPVPGPPSPGPPRPVPPTIPHRVSFMEQLEQALLDLLTS